MVSAIRPPVVAGTFYPGDKQVLQKAVNDYLEDAVCENHHVKALIVPHAGYVYSGPIAASAYAQILPDREKIKRVILLGPSHRVAFNGMATSSAEYFNTPLGNIPLDVDAIQMISDLPFVEIFNDAHKDEHSLEVQLPFLQEILDDFTLVPVVVGDAPAEQVASVIEKLFGGDETLIVISSDLSHYHAYNIAREIDSRTADAILSMEPEHIQYEQACGRNPVNGMLLAARKKGMSVALLDLRNSGDTAGSKDKVVGYGAFSFEEHANRR